MTRFRRGPARHGSPHALAAAFSAAAWVAAGCTIPITAQTLSGGALNAGALLFIDQLNDGSDAAEGSYTYTSQLAIDTLATLFEAAVEEANRSHMFARRPSDSTPVVADADADADADAEVDAEGVEADAEAVDAVDGVVLAQAAGRAWRPDDPPRPETFSDRQWTPAPLFSVRAGSPEVRGDTLMWIVTHRASRQAAFLLTPRDGGSATRVSLVPYDPPADVFLSVPSDHAQRNAVEALHQVFYFAALERFGPGVFAGRVGDPAP